MTISSGGKYAGCAEAAGFSTTSVENGLQALAAVRKAPDLLVLDAHMPDMDGPEACRSLKADPATAGIPCFFSPPALPMRRKPCAAPAERRHA